jgi:NAD(P)-dependent dehydrogenase (short-subunit alcohol dehydrogenase family)
MLQGLSLEPGVALVTGGASGIGAAACELLQREGIIVASLDRATGGPADLHVECDVTDAHALDDAFARVNAELGAPRHVFANAGVVGPLTVLDGDPTEWDRVMDVDLRAVYLTIRAASRTMVDAGLTGSIVVTSSCAGRVADVGLAAYSVAKAALHQLVRVSARELAPRDIRVNGVAPGMTETPLTSPALADPAQRAERARKVPMGRIGEASDIAETALALFALRWVTGEVIAADGGQSLSGPNAMPAY